MPALRPAAGRHVAGRGRGLRPLPQQLAAQGCRWAASARACSPTACAANARAKAILLPPLAPRARPADRFLPRREALRPDRLRVRQVARPRRRPAFRRPAGAIRDEAPAGETPLVCVILDGENAWEHYPYNAYYFFEDLYGLLAAQPWLATTTYSDWLARHPERAGSAAGLVAGSWVYGTFSTWIGDPDKNRAWDLLCAAKQAYDLVMDSGRLDEAPRSAPPKRSWRSAKARTGSGGSATTTRARRWKASTRCSAPTSPISTACCGCPSRPQLAVPLSSGGGSPEGGGAMRRASFRKHDPTDSLLLGVHAHQPVGNFSSVLEEAHERCYRPFLHVLHRYPEFRFAAHFSGWLLDWLLEHHPQDMALLKEMVARGQVELFGAGDCEPVLAAIPQRDRIGQINVLTDKLQRRFGARVEGAWLTERVYIPTVVPALADCGMKYVTVDDYHFLCTGKMADELDGFYTTEEDGRPSTFSRSRSSCATGCPSRPPRRPSPIWKAWPAKATAPPSTSTTSRSSASGRKPTSGSTRRAGSSSSSRACSPPPSSAPRPTAISMPATPRAASSTCRPLPTSR
jgi:hypothetical protein